MQMIEKIAVAIAGPDDSSCPFPHGPFNSNAKNDMNNNPSKLSDKLDEESNNNQTIEIKSVPGLVSITLGSSSQNCHHALFVAHHLIPGNASWPKSDLFKWVDKSRGHVNADIEYDVNDFKNGIDLPSNKAIGSFAGRLPQFQENYSFACMAYDPKIRQFHDSHNAYSKFVIKVLNKIAATLDGRPESSMGCDKCMSRNQKPFNPPIHIRTRIHDAASRLKNYLYGSPLNWKIPLFTSRFALMYKKNSLDQTQARAKLAEAFQKITV